MSNIVYKNVQCHYGATPVLNDISFAVETGTCCALIGHNGAGKTTLIKLLLGMIETTAGSVKLCQHNPIGAHEKQIKKQIGFVPESINFLLNETGLEFMQYVAQLKSASAEDIQQKMELTNIAFAQHKKIGTYSKGMKQRLGLAQAMLGDPSVLILDEPASGLDPDSRQILYRSLQTHAKAGNTVMFSSHALNDIEPYIDQVVLLNKGKVLLDCSILEYRQSLKLPVMIEIELENPNDTFFDELKKFGELSYKGNIAHIKVDYSNKLAALGFISHAPYVRDLRLLDASLETIYHELLNNEKSA